MKNFMYMLRISNKAWRAGFILLCAVWVPQISHASFALSGSTIVQTGSDTDLSGLASITGVTVVSSGSGDNQYTVYSVGDKNLRVNGTLTIPVQKEKIVFGTNAPFQSIQVNGVLNIEGRNTAGGVTRYYNKEFAVITRYTTNRSSKSSGGLVVNGSGKLYWHGGSLRTSQTSYFDPGSTVVLDHAEFNVQHAPTTDFQIRSYSTNLTIESVTTNATFLLYRDPGVVIKNVTGIQSPFAVMSYGSPGSTFTYEDYTGLGNLADISFIDSSKTDFINPADGSATKVGLFRGFATGGNSRHKGLVKIYKDFFFLFTDIQGDPLEGVYYHIKDQDNGNRVSSVLSDDTASNVYFASSSAAGTTTPDRLLLAVVNKTDTVYEHPLSASYYDYRGAHGDNSDIFDTYFWGYNEQGAHIALPYKGVGVKEFDVTLLPDLHIQESDEAVVHSYASIDNLAQLYDRAKLWKVESFVLEYPTIDGQLIKANGAQLDLGSQNLIIDPAAPAAFAVSTSTNTITIRSGDLQAGGEFTNFVTTGLVTYAGSAEQSTEYTDSTGFHPVDAVAPTVAITAPTKLSANTITDTTVQVLDDRGIDKDQVFVDPATTVSFRNFNCTQTNTKQVDCTLHVTSSGDLVIRARDEFANTGSSSVSGYTIDDQPPVVSVSIDTQTPYSLATPNITFSATDNITPTASIGFEVSVDDGPFSAQTSPYQPVLSNGPHKVTVRARDGFNNTANYTVRYNELFLIDTPTVFSGAAIGDTKITFVSSNDFTSASITGAGSSFNCSPSITGSFPITGPIVCTGLVTETGDVTVAASDTVISSFDTVSYVIEALPPQVNIVAPHNSGEVMVDGSYVEVTDETKITMDQVVLDTTSTAGVAGFSCVQTSTKQVRCDFKVTYSGDVVIKATDIAGNVSTSSQSYQVSYPQGTSSGGGGSVRVVYYCNNPESLNYISKKNRDLIKSRSPRTKMRESCFFAKKEQIAVLDEPNVVSDDRINDLLNQIDQSSRCTPLLSTNISRHITNNSNEVKALQTFLNTQEGEQLSVDGIYNDDDYEAVKRFQNKYKTSVLDIWGLDTATGYVGRTTRLKINALQCKQAVNTQCPVFTQYHSIKNPNHGPQVGKTQQVLQDLGFYQGDINNQYDQSTIAAMIRFQETFYQTMLQPWGLTKGTGYQYKTTNKFLNELVGCTTQDLTLENGNTVSY